MFTVRSIVARTAGLAVIVGIHFLCFGSPGWFDSDASTRHHASEAARPVVADDTTTTAD